MICVFLKEREFCAVSVHFICYSYHVPPSREKSEGSYFVLEFWERVFLSYVGSLAESALVLGAGQGALCMELLGSARWNCTLRACPEPLR